MADEDAKTEENPEDDVSAEDGEEDLDKAPEDFDEKDHKEDD
jgi:hypothetical protein